MNSTISSQQGQIGAQGTTIASQSAVIGSQSLAIESESATISVLSGSVSSLQANATAYRSLMAELNTMIVNDKAEVATLTSKLTTANGTITSDAFTIASLNSQIKLGQSELANYSSIILLQYSISLVSNQPVTIYGTTHESSSPFVTFSPNYAGFVLISVSSPSETYLVNATAKPAYFNINFVTYESLMLLAPVTTTVFNYFIVPISPGTLNSFALLTTSATDGTATATATYYY